MRPQSSRRAGYERDTPWTSTSRRLPRGSWFRSQAQQCLSRTSTIAIVAPSRYHIFLGSLFQRISIRRRLAVLDSSPLRPLPFKIYLTSASCGPYRDTTSYTTFMLLNATACVPSPHVSTSLTPPSILESSRPQFYESRELIPASTSSLSYF